MDKSTDDVITILNQMKMEYETCLNIPPCTQPYYLHLIEAIKFFNHMIQISTLRKITMYQILLDVTNCEYVLSTLKHRHPQLPILVKNAICKAEDVYWNEILQEDLCGSNNQFVFSSCIPNKLFEYISGKYADDKNIIHIVYEYLIQKILKNPNTYQYGTTAKFYNFVVNSHHITQEQCDYLKLCVIGCNLGDLYIDEYVEIFIRDLEKMPDIKYLLAEKCVDHKSTHYTDDDTVKILLEYITNVQSGNCINELHICNTNIALLSFDPTYDLLIMILENRSTHWTTTECEDVFDKKSNSKKYITLKQQFYEQNKLKCVRKMTIANNSSNFNVLCKIGNNTFKLCPHERKLFDNTQLNNIDYVPIDVNIVDNNQKVFSYDAIEIDTYVAIFGTLSCPKYAVYFENDCKKEYLEPTSQMVVTVGKILHDEYEKRKHEYPSMTMSDFIRGLGCDDIGTDISDTPFARQINNIMRPEQLKKAIEIILFS